MKNIIVFTGGAGFVGSNLIEYFLKKSKKFKIISLDNYSTGTKKNHIKNPRVSYIYGNTIAIKKHLNKFKKIFIHSFILESLQEFIKVFKILMNILNQIQLVLMKFLNFVWIIKSN